MEHSETVELIGDFFMTEHANLSHEFRTDTQNQSAHKEKSIKLVWAISQASSIRNW